MKLEESRIVLTGAAGGLGRAIAAALAGRGARLLLTDIDALSLEQAAGDLPAGAPRPHTLAADITRPEGRQALVEAAAGLEGGVNVLVNNAGLGPFGLLEDIEESAIEATFRVNLLAPVLLTRALLPALTATGDGHVVNMGSIFGSIGYPAFSAYCASKFGLRGFTEAMRREWADRPVRFHYLAPRAARTRLNSDAVCAMNEELGVAMDPPEVVARGLIELLERGRDVVYLGWPEKFYVRINALAPGAVDGSLRKQLPVIRRHAARNGNGTSREVNER